MKVLRGAVLTLAVLVCFSVRGVAQDDLGKQLSKVAGPNAVSYLTPLLSGWGADLNSGFYYSADLHSVLGFDIGLKASAVFVKDEDKTFDFTLPDRITYTGVTLNAGVDYDKIVSGSPTAVGDKTGKDVKVKSTSNFIPLRGQTIFTTPPGYDLKYVPLLVPQASIGLPLGLEVIGRFVPPVSVGDAGKVNFIGFGLRHNIDQYIPLMPINISVHFMTQKLTLSDNNDKKLLSATGTAYGVEVSKSFALVTLYGGFQLEKSMWDIEPYSFNNPESGGTIQVEGFSVEGKNKSRFHGGIRFLLLFVNIHADYSFSEYPVATAGVGISFR
ncbi:MAG: hypothetical protein HY276_04365 [Ignavibacteriales bacterium]|nr:hypothetical protein [Ignavibacteriales bacterium]